MDDRYKIVKPKNGKYGVLWSGEPDYNYMPRSTHRDNKKAYNTGSGSLGCNSHIRVPSLKRSNKTWKQFYDLFPFLKGLKEFRGCKLKKI